MAYGRSIVLAACAGLLAAPALAQDIERYQLQRTADGYVRLDTQTGRMTLCRESSGQLVCRAAAEERDAYDRQVEALEDRVAALESRVGALDSGRPAAELPSEEEFEQTLSYMERFFRRFMGIVTELDRNFGGKQDEGPIPDRT